MTALVWVRQYLCDPVFGINIIHVDVCVLTKAQQELNFVAFDNIGYLDAHLLAAVSLTPPARLWTRDKRLAVVAANLGLAYR